MTFHILIDDCRNLNGMDFIVRTPDAAVQFLDKFDTTGHVVYMDNDLALEGLEGHQILSHLIAMGQRPTKVVLVTSNPVAAERMRDRLNATGYKENLNRVEYDWVG